VVLKTKRNLSDVSNGRYAVNNGALAGVAVIFSRQDPGC